MTKHVVMVEVTVALTKEEIGKAVTLTGITGNPAGTVLGLQHLDEIAGDPKQVRLTMESAAGTLVL